MFDNLLKLGISQDTIDKMIDNYNVSIVSELEMEYENVFKILNALKMLRINDIDELLINKKDLFLMDYDKFMSKLKGKDLKEVSELINASGGFAIDDIFFND